MDELAVLDGGKCTLQLRGVRPFLSEKYDITKHPNYKYLSDADRRNTFDIEKFLRTCNFLRSGVNLINLICSLRLHFELGG